MNSHSNSRVTAAIVLMSILLLILISIAYVDRAASTFAYTHLHRPSAMVWLTHLVDPLEPLAIVGLAASAAGALFWGWRPGPRGRAFISGCIAILVAVATKEMLKYVFGRTWPETWTGDNPSWIRDDAYGFHLFHGGEGWASFPSGHTTQIATFATVLWLSVRRLRWLAIALVLLVGIGLWGADFHFVGDILAGAALGAACGWGTFALICGADRRGSAE